jgi:hypothetical protein
LCSTFQKTVGVRAETGFVALKDLKDVQILPVCLVAQTLEDVLSFEVVVDEQVLRSRSFVHQERG